MKQNFGLPQEAVHQIQPATDDNVQPTIILPEMVTTLKATKKQQESARVVMETRII